MFKGHDASEALVGLDPDCPQYDHKEATEWMLVERIANEGGTLSNVSMQTLKAFAGQSCSQAGNWWSPANKSSLQYFFVKGEIFPKIESDWGETIWYLEITNKE